MTFNNWYMIHSLEFLIAKINQNWIDSRVEDYFVPSDLLFGLSNEFQVTFTIFSFILILETHGINFSSP